MTLYRHKPVRRKTSLRPKTPNPLKRGRIKPTNPKRKAKAFAKAYHSEERVEFIRTLPCAVDWCDATRSDNAHIAGAGAGLKAGYVLVIALCRAHHTRLDTHPEGRRGFEQEYGLNLPQIAQTTHAAWLKYAAMAYPLLETAPDAP